MAPSVCIDLNERERRQLLSIARDSIELGLETDSVPLTPEHSLSPALRERMGVFVTLTMNERLRGCIGSMQSDQALCHSVAHSAFDAAFRDPRFASVGQHEVRRIRIEVSVLSRTEPVTVSTREELLESVQPGVDGLLLEERNYRATFLPKVWDQLPEPHQFLEQLLLKAGLPADYWSSTLRLSRYRTLTFAESEQAQVTPGGDNSYAV